MDFESGGVSTGTLDSTQAYKGTRSVKVTSAANQFLSMNVPSSNFWVRAFVRSSGSQQYPMQGLARPHGVFLRAIDGSKQLRVGDHRCQLDINRDGGGWDDLEMISGSYGADDTICADKVGARMIPNTWYCLEAHYNGPGSEVQVFWDNQNVEQLHVKATRIATNADKKIENGYNNQYGNSTVKWGPSNFTKLEFGYQSFNNLGTTPNMTVWYDNVATSSQRIGCGADYKVKAALTPQPATPATPPKNLALAVLPLQAVPAVLAVQPLHPLAVAMPSLARALRRATAAQHPLVGSPSSPTVSCPIPAAQPTAHWWIAVVLTLVLSRCG